MTPPERRSGILIPLFSFPSSTSWGVGDIGDIDAMTAWLAAAGQRALQLLPVNEMAAEQQSPYSALSAMAIDPIYIRIDDALRRSGVDGSFENDAESDAMLADVRCTPRVDYRRVRRLKAAALQEIFRRFADRGLTGEVRRPAAFSDFITANAWWLDDYALFRAIYDREGSRPWTEWPAPLGRRDPAALDRVRRELSREVSFYQFLQWLADAAWQAARAAAAARGVAIFGDLPFMVDTNSADVWARQHQFRLDVSVGAPPDAFSAEGQDWGTPMYDWAAMAEDNFGWLRDRARRSAALYDAYRIDHLVGFYRTYGRPRDGGGPFFSPSEEAHQVALGETVLRIFRDAGAEIIAEDLGTVPDYVRASLARLSIPGFRVLRWERHWHAPGQPFRDPAEYPAISVATSGTHDTEPLVTWWDNASREERRLLSEVGTVQRLTGGAGLLDAPFEPRGRDTLLESLFASGSNLVLTVIQDLFGWRDRINDPATMSGDNWTFRLPWPIDRLNDIPEVCERQAKLREWTERYGR